MLMKMGMMVGSMSGKLGTHVCSHNKGGAYARMNSLNTNPATPEQQVVRDSLSNLSTRWRDVLTQNQRDQWTAYALGSPLVNRLGESRDIPPLAMYIRCNVPRLQTGLPPIDDGPIVNGDGTLSPPTLGTFTAHPGNMAVGFTTITAASGDTWNTPTNGAGLLALYMSPPQNETVVFFKGPYRLSDTLLNSGTNPKTSWFDAFPAGAGQKKFYRFVALCEDGRLSNTIEGSILVP